MEYTKRYMKSFFYIGLILYCIIYILAGDKLTLASVIGLITFFSYGVLLLYFQNRDDDYYTSIKLAMAVFSYSSIIVCLFYLISEYYDGDTYLFSKIDAFLYEDLSRKMITKSFSEGVAIMQKNFRSFDDWGAPFVMSSILRIYPTKEFLNFFYIVFGTLNALYLFGLGKIMMDKKMAFLASFTFSASSFFVYFHGTFLKESVFVLLVVGTFYHFYKLIQDNNTIHIIPIIFYFISMIFFRPAVAMFFGLGVTVYYLTDKDNRAIFYLIYLAIFFAFIAGASIVGDVYDRYTLGGNVHKVVESRETVVSVQFDYITNWLATFIGPFPSFVALLKHQTCLYAPGLFAKMALSLPFLLSIIYVVRYRIRELYPMVVFCLVEMFSLAIIRQAFELRKGIPHYPIIFLLAFWYMSVACEEESRFKRLSPIWFTIVAIIVFGWNILRT